MVRLLILLVLAVLVGGSLLLWEHLGGWAILIVPVVLYLLAKSVGGWLLKQLFMAPFRAKGAVLRGASVTVHSVAPRPAPPPPREDEQNESEKEKEEARRSWRWYALEATVSPNGSGSGPFHLWEPCSLGLGPPDCKPEDDDEDDRECEVKEIEVQEEGAFKPDEGMKYPGPQRLRLLLRVKPGSQRLVFTYYFEKFGELRIPA